MKRAELKFLLTQRQSICMFDFENYFVCFFFFFIFGTVQNCRSHEKLREMGLCVVSPNTEGNNRAFTLMHPQSGAEPYLTNSIAFMGKQFFVQKLKNSKNGMKHPEMLKECKSGKQLKRRNRFFRNHVFLSGWGGQTNRQMYRRTNIEVT